MTEVINKKTGERYISKISIQKKRWMSLMQDENPEFFEHNEIADLFFMPLDGDV